jgi:hypothetical protein
MKQNVERYLTADSELITVGHRLAYHQEIVECCTMIIKELTSRTYAIRSGIDWHKYTQGAT